MLQVGCLGGTSQNKRAHLPPFFRAVLVDESFSQSASQSAFRAKQGCLVSKNGNDGFAVSCAAGCRLVQLALETGCHEAALLTRELHGHVQEAAVSPHANYVIQKVCKKNDT